MNDRFKFRSWHEPTKTMEYNGLWTGRNWDKKLSDCNFILMQCTGLKDKNGTLIYEGDILKAYYVDSDTEKIEFDYMPVGFDDESVAFYMGAKHKEYFADGLFIPEEYEVVGNIYENKELLEDK